MLDDIAERANESLREQVGAMIAATGKSVATPAWQNIRSAGEWLGALRRALDVNGVS